MCWTVFAAPVVLYMCKLAPASFVHVCLRMQQCMHILELYFFSKKQWNRHVLIEKRQHIQQQVTRPEEHLLELELGRTTNGARKYAHIHTHTQIEAVHFNNNIPCAQTNKMR